ncbi:alginate export family protein [Alkalimonas delamerensis]|uniref:Alginate export family protein n=1 Tax=Alkalimonas delamerensis TaxID=265981 RepID=A0ABT9GNE6_9GAMM|nr:alginate export family protein [Alkalimonas delamerensis]MDP4528444.1 alginate export family protein [Alkalimonas delamerensis]
MKSPLFALPCLALVPSLALAAANSSANTLSAALNESQLKANFRYRIEHVDQDNPLKDALASTLRSRLTLTTGKAYGFSGLLEVDNVSVLGGQTYNSTVNGNGHYSVVADPKGTDINQAALKYQLSEDTSFTMGRQRVNHLNQRFLGGVGWRQNEQTFDGYRLQHSFTPAITLDLALLHNVNRVFGPKGPAANQRGEFYTGLLSWQLNPNQQLAAYGYDLDFNDWAVRSSLTYGLDYQGKWALGEQQSLSLQLAAARQQDRHDAPLSYQHHYHRVQLSWQQQKLQLIAGTERLAGDGSSAFQTPLATLHAFQGFADLFLVTPNDGLRDYWLGVRHPAGPVQLALNYHRYHSDTDGRRYGSEWNLTASYRFSNQLQGMLKLADYQASSFAVDSRKLWLMLSYSI